MNSNGRDRSWIFVSVAFIAVATAVYFSAMNHRERIAATNAATIASGLAAMVSLILLEISFKRGAEAVAGAFVASCLLRSAISIGGCIAAIFIWHVPPTTTLLTMTIYYFATLAAETYITVERLKTMQSSTISRKVS